MKGKEERETERSREREREEGVGKKIKEAVKEGRTVEKAEYRLFPIRLFPNVFNNLFNRELPSNKVKVND